MIAPVLAGLGLAARALLKTPAGQRAIARGSKAVERFLKRNDPKSFAATPAQKTAGQRLQKTMKRRRRNEKIRGAAAAGAAGVAVGRDTKKGVREDWRDMKANAIEEGQQRTRAAAAKEKRQKISLEAATLRGIRSKSTYSRKPLSAEEKARLIKSSIDGPIVRKGKTRAPHR